MSKRPKGKTTKKRKSSRRWWPGLGALIGGGLLAAFAGLLLLLLVNGLITGGEQEPKFEPDITETLSASHGEEPFEGGPRLHFPVDSMDFGFVPLGTEVSYAFVVRNVGDAAAEIDDVSVEVLEGC